MCLTVHYIFHRACEPNRDGNVSSERRQSQMRGRNCNCTQSFKVSAEARTCGNHRCQDCNFLKEQVDHINDHPVLIIPNDLATRDSLMALITSIAGSVEELPITGYAADPYAPGSEYGTRTERVGYTYEDDLLPRRGAASRGAGFRSSQATHRTEATEPYGRVGYVPGRESVSGRHLVQQRNDREYGQGGGDAYGGSQLGSSTHGGGQRSGYYPGSGGSSYQGGGSGVTSRGRRSHAGAETIDLRPPRLRDQDNGYAGAETIDLRPPRLREFRDEDDY